MDSWPGPCSHRPVHAVWSSAPFAEVRLFGSGVRQLDTRSIGCLHPRCALCHGFLPHQRNALFRHAHPNVGSGVRRLRATHGLCHCHLPSCARCCMDYSLQHAVVRQGDGQDSRLPALVQPFRSHPLHPCRLILYCHNYFITFIQKHL